MFHACADEPAPRLLAGGTYPGHTCAVSFTSPAASPMPSYLSLQALTVSYGGPPVLDRVSLGVERGGMVALLGRSGGGETTLLRANAGFVIPGWGLLWLEG